MIKIFKTGGVEYFNWMENNLEAFVLNTGKAVTSTDFCLHKANCTHIKRSKGLDDDAFTTRNQMKVASADIAELVEYCRNEKDGFREEWQLCRTCKPERDIWEGKQYFNERGEQFLSTKRINLQLDDTIVRETKEELLPTAVAQVHEELLQYLAALDVFFATRKINRKGRLAQGLWFLGNEDYMCVSFWSGYDLQRKIPNIYLEINFDNPSEVFLVTTSREDTSKLPILDRIREDLQLIPAGRKNSWTKSYRIATNNTEEYIRVIKEFLKHDKLVIDKIISENEHEHLRHITSPEFAEQIENLNQYRSTGSRVYFTGHRRIKPRKRTGVDHKNEEGQIRNILRKTLSTASQEHNKLQNKLYGQLSEEEDVRYIIMEENYIDLLRELDDVIELYEVKPYSTATKCIREGLGQLLLYYHQTRAEYQKPVKLIIAGPNQPRDEDLEFIRFIKKSTSIPIEYVGID